MATKKSKGVVIAEECRDLFQQRSLNLSAAEYKIAVEHLASVLEGIEDCLRDEEQG